MFILECDNYNLCDNYIIKTQISHREQLSDSFHQMIPGKYFMSTLHYHSNIKNPPTHPGIYSINSLHKRRSQQQSIQTYTKEK